MPPNYSNGQIYRIVDNTINQQYFGSTTIELSQRLAGHVSKYKCWKGGKTNYTSSFKILENGDYNIVLVEEFPCENSEQLRQKERYHIENNKCVNLRNPLQTLEELRQYYPKYYQDHKDTINAKHKVKHTCCCGGKYIYGLKSRHFKTANIAHTPPPP